MNQPTHDDLQRSIGRVEGNQDAMETRLDRLEGAVARGFDDVKNAIADMRADFDKRLATIEARENQRKGAWAVLMTLGGAAGGFAVWLVQHFWRAG